MNLNINSPEYQHVSKLLDKGVEKKRLGDYEGAKKLYYKAIELDPTRRMAFYSLAKLCYLTGERREAIVNYLRAAHLLYNNRPDNNPYPTPSREIISQILNTLPEEYHDMYNIYQKLAPLIANFDIARQLGHVIVDLDKINLPSPDLRIYIKHYRQLLSGKQGELSMELEENFYFPIGLVELLSKLKWHVIDNEQVLKVYIGPKEQRLNIIKDEDAPIDSLINTCITVCTCNTAIKIVINWGTMSFRCPVCKDIYIVEPLGKVEHSLEQFGSISEIGGVKIQIFSNDFLPAFDENYDKAKSFFLAKVGTLDKVLIADIASKPGEADKVFGHDLTSSKKTDDKVNAGSKDTLNKLTQLLNQEVDEPNSLISTPNVKQIKKWWQFWK